MNLAQRARARAAALLLRPFIAGLGVSSSPVGSLEALRERTSDENQSKREYALRELLRRFPYWCEGHLHLANECLERGDVRTAYHSARAVLSAALSPSLSREAERVLGRCYLASGDPGRALQIFETLLAGHHDAALTEDKAAALMALGRTAEAREVLLGIEARLRSSSARAVLEFLGGDGGN